MNSPKKNIIQLTRTQLILVSRKELTKWFTIKMSISTVLRILNKFLARNLIQHKRSRNNNCNIKSMTLYPIKYKDKLMNRFITANKTHSKQTHLLRNRIRMNLAVKIQTTKNKTGDSSIISFFRLKTPFTKFQKLIQIFKSFRSVKLAIIDYLQLIDKKTQLKKEISQLTKNNQQTTNKLK